jgi:hypothetical protein
VPDQRFGIRHRLAQLTELPSWSFAGAAVPGSGSSVDRLREIVTAAVLRHRTHGYGNPVMLVHAATAPAAVLRILPALPESLHEASVAAAWAATAAVTAAYSPATPDAASRPLSPTFRDALRPDLLVLACDLAYPPHDAAAPAARSSHHAASLPADHRDAVAAIMSLAVASGDAHAIKFADAAIEAFGFSGDLRLLAAADNATVMID